MKCALKGARFVASIEVEDGKRLAESLVKQLTGGDRIKARRMREDFWEFDPTHKVFLVANHRPVVAGTDYALWRRIKMIPFGVTIPEDERDPHLLEKLRSELSGILAWAVRGCLDWQREGLGEPKEVKAATDEYKVEQDVLATFIEEACVVDPEASDTAGNLYSAYVEWCEETGESPETQRKFGTRLREKGFERREGTTGGRKGRYVYHGIAVFRPGGLPGGPPKRGGGGPSSQKVHPTNSLQNAGQSFKSGEAVDLSGPKSGMTGLEVTSSRGDSEKRSTMVHSSTDGPPVPPPTHSAWGTDPEDEEPTDNPVSPSAYDIKPALERVYERLGYAPVKPAAVAKEAGLPEDEVRGLLARGEANDTFTEITPGAYVPRHQFEAGVKLALARIGRPATASEIADVAKATPEKVTAYLQTGPRRIIKSTDGLYALTYWPGVGRGAHETPCRDLDFGSEEGSPR